jgi:hypothetical protein
MLIGLDKVSKLSEFLKGYNPHASTSDREQFEESIKSQVQQIVKPIFYKKLFSDDSNTMSVKLKRIYRLRPNNYSIKMPISTLQSLPLLPMEYKEKKMRGWTGYIIKDYNGCTVEINKKQIIFYLVKKEERLVPYPDTKETMKKIENDMVLKLLIVARQFKKETKLDFDIDKWIMHRKEMGLKGDINLDNIPSDFNIHTDLFKKVYEKETEFFDESSVTNYITNRALEDLSPEVVKEIIDLKKIMCSSLSTLQAISNTQLMIVQLLKEMKK